MIVELSYLIEENENAPGQILNLPLPKINWRSKFGDGQNKQNQTSTLEIFNHNGTHIDTPLHLFPDGKSVKDYDISDFVFNKPFLISCIKNDFEKIEPKDFEFYHNKIKDSDLLLFYTGFSKYRFTDPKRFVVNSPAFSEESARYIINNFPNIRCIGMDFMSIENIPEGKKNGFPVHKIILGSQNIFFIIEDMNLFPAIKKKLKNVIVAPLRIEAEASPSTIIAEVE